MSTDRLLASRHLVLSLARGRLSRAIRLGIYRVHRLGFFGPVLIECFLLPDIGFLIAVHAPEAIDAASAVRARLHGAPSRSPVEGGHNAETGS